MKPISHNKLTDTKYNKPKPIPSILNQIRYQVLYIPNPISSILNYFLILFNGFLLNGFYIF